jgi:hypothetical protein
MKRRRLPVPPTRRSSGESSGPSRDGMRNAVPPRAVAANAEAHGAAAHHASSSPRRRWNSAPSDVPVLWQEGQQEQQHEHQQPFDDGRGADGDRELELWGGDAGGGGGSGGGGGGGAASGSSNNSAAMAIRPTVTPDPPYGGGGAEEELTPMQRARLRKAAQRQKENEARERELARARHEVFVDRCVLHGVEPPPGGPTDAAVASAFAPLPELPRTYHDSDGYDNDVDYHAVRTTSAPEHPHERSRGLARVRTVSNPSQSSTLSPAERARLRKEERLRAEREAHLKQLEAAREQAFRERCELESRHRPEPSSGGDSTPTLRGPSPLVGAAAPHHGGGGGAAHAHRISPTRSGTSYSPPRPLLPPLEQRDDDGDDGLTPAERVKRRKERRQREEQERQALALAEAHRQAHIDRVRLAQKVTQSPPQANDQHHDESVSFATAPESGEGGGGGGQVDEGDQDGMRATRVLPRFEVLALGQEADALAAEVSKFKEMSVGRMTAVSPRLALPR